MPVQPLLPQSKIIPPRLVEAIVDKRERTPIQDEWAKQNFPTGKYKASELYPAPPGP